MNAICRASPDKWLKRRDYCGHCKKKTISGIQDYYDDLFCKGCGKIKGGI